MPKTKENKAINLGKQVESGKKGHKRWSYGKIDEVFEMPNFIDIQKESYKWFQEEGLREVFDDISPIRDNSGTLELSFGDYEFVMDENSNRSSEEECKKRGITYSTKLKVAVTLTKKDENGNLEHMITMSLKPGAGENGEDKDDRVFMGDFPLMTDNGTFVYNGSERVVVTQIVRSPGAYYVKDIDKNKKWNVGGDQYTSQIIPNRGAWIETEADKDGIINVKLDRGAKQPLPILLRAFGLENRDGVDQIFEYFGESEKLSIAIDAMNAKGKINTKNDGLKALYRTMRPDDRSGDGGEDDAFVRNADSFISNMFFDPKRYDLGRVGRYKYNKKLGLTERILGQKLAEDIETIDGEVFEKGQVITREMARTIENSVVLLGRVPAQYVLIQDPKNPEGVIRVVGNAFVDTLEILDYVKEEYGFTAQDLKELRVADKVYYPLLQEILADETIADKDAFAKALKKNRFALSPKHLLETDLFAAVGYLLNLYQEIGHLDDIDHLGNRRLKTVGELLQNQFRIGLARMEKSVREKMSVQDQESMTPQQLLNVRPVSSAIREFFGSSQLSQFMDQNNPLSEITHKRRISALGPGGLTRERAGLEVRDIHHSHYGRLCPIETPEGPNIGLIGSLTAYGRVNEYGFIETPYRRVEKVLDKDGNVVNSRVTDKVDYLDADSEESLVIAQANEPLDADGCFINAKVAARSVIFNKATLKMEGEISLVARERVDYMDVSPKQVVSVASAMIPFLEKDDAKRALMGSNMQRQAVPLLVTEAPIVATGMEAKAARDSGAVILSEASGVVSYVDADRIVVTDELGEEHEHVLLKFQGTNQGTCINQRPIVNHGDKVEKGEVIADGPSTALGEISLGKNLLIGFMTWEGYNFEDAIVLNERLLMDDVLTSIHIEKHETEAREIKALGSEKITSEIPGKSEEALKNLKSFDPQEDGIIHVGAKVSNRAYLVGKTTPKGDTEETPEDKLLRAVFGEKVKEVKDTSLRLPHGQAGVVIATKQYDRTNAADREQLAPGVDKVVKVYVATKRKINVGDKMSGRHGNKGVVSKILPQEDMPFMEDGTPLQVMLNPLGVPSRMNIGQVLEVHLGLAAKAKAEKEGVDQWYVATPVFDGASEQDVIDLLKDCDMPETGRLRLRDGRTGEYFENPVTVGYMYMLKLHHLVDDKIHARSTGTYSLITQQPLGGKAQFGGQRFGEMEVWALEAYGAAYTLQEILTVKSDDRDGRTATYQAIAKGGNLSKPGIPASFEVLKKEMQSLGLDIRAFDENDEEIFDDAKMKPERDVKAFTQGDDDMFDDEDMDILREDDFGSDMHIVTEEEDANL
ncbi:MAG: DNA-directed RNA polymerase subunit beta [Clostridia bacterium]|nr:DNA-directed RNA polymerase subunit beta [Clostridia bacterium]